MNKKTITLRWPPTAEQLAKGLIIFYLLVANFILIPAGFMSADGSGLQALAILILFIEIVASLIWVVLVLL